jgi:hypothetical protein
MLCKATVNAQEIDIPKINDGFYYMASPYSNAIPHIEVWRYDQNVEVLSKLTKMGYIVVSPIVHSHPMAHRHEMPKDFEYWQRVDRVLMSKASGLIVLMLEDWKNSKGVMAEIEYMEEKGLSVYYLDYYHNELQYYNGEEIPIQVKVEA